MKIGYIGLGAMGGALARRLLQSHPLQVWDLQPAAIDRFVQLGAKAAASPADLVRDCDFIMTCLPRSSNVHELFFGAGRGADGVSSGKILIDQTSGDPSETAKIASRLAASGVAMLDAPVSGGQRGAEAGTIAIMVAGPQQAYDRALPVLHAISPNVDYCGHRTGDAHAMKVVNNTMSASSRLATLEVVAMGRKMGLSLATITEAINSAEGSNRTSTVSLPALLEGRSPVGEFALALLVKDLNLGTDLGMKCGVPMMIANLVRSYHEMALNLLGPAAQLRELFDVVEKMAGTCFVVKSEEARTIPQHADSEAAKRISRTVAACNLLITYECAALAAKFGLPLDLMAKIFLQGGAWNRAAERVLPVLSSGKPTSDLQLGALISELRVASEMAKGCGAPMTVGHLVRGLVETGINQIGRDASIDALSRLFETMAGVRFVA
ncbi:NAD(P)-binding domain-containing protein [Burkholderia anthina]|uniref:NAD(P)-binding domain-containing protein n=1 Tax=Burkholderia anthina TaxID=179879 RepID=UPI00158F343E|nr:NAD(P)-binding domain-containing protein [Burkholderia anthina]